MRLNMEALAEMAKPVEKTVENEVICRLVFPVSELDNVDDIVDCPYRVKGKKVLKAASEAVTAGKTELNHGIGTAQYIVFTVMNTVSDDPETGQIAMKDDKPVVAPMSVVDIMGQKAEGDQSGNDIDTLISFRGYIETRYNDNGERQRSTYRFNPVSGSRRNLNPVYQNTAENGRLELTPHAQEHWNVLTSLLKNSIIAKSHEDNELGHERKEFLQNWYRACYRTQRGQSAEEIAQSQQRQTGNLQTSMQSVKDALDDDAE
jgi:hypothetical protein